MNNCPTGYCGDPCLCKGALDHLSRSDAEAMLELAKGRMATIDLKQQEVKTGEAMVAYEAIEVRIAAIKYESMIVTTDYLLDRAIIRKGFDGINTVSGMLSVQLDADLNPVFSRGQHNASSQTVRFEVLNYKGDVSVSIDCAGRILQEAYVKLVPTVVYLPADME